MKVDDDIPSSVRKYLSKIRSIPSNPITHREDKSPNQVRIAGIPSESKMKIILAVATVVVFLVILSQSAVIVPAGHRGVVLYFGAVEDVILPEGFSLIIPFAERVEEMEVRTVKFEDIGVATSKDLQSVTTTITLNFHLDPAIVDDIYQQFGFEYGERIVTPTIKESVKAVTAIYTAEELITKRPEVKENIGSVIRETLIERGIITEQVFITDFEFSPDFAKSVEDKVVAEQDALREKNVLEKIRIQAQQREADAIGIANANIAEAKGEAQAIQIIQQQLRESPDYLRWLAVNNWDGKLPIFIGGGAFPFIDITTFGLPAP